LCADSSQWFDLRSPFYIDCSDISGSNTNSRPTFISVVMASTPFPDTDMQGTYREMLTSEIHHDQAAIGEDPSSVSFIPRSARTVPQALTVHTIYLKKITYPMTSHQPELWVLERNHDGLETWRPVETSWATFNILKTPEFYEQLLTSGDFTTKFLLFPRHPQLQLFIRYSLILNINVHFGQPVTVIPDPYILQSCWGRSAQHHSQGTPTSLYWPPWRSTPPSSPTRTRLKQTTPI
jgi:hypothetical protein